MGRACVVFGCKNHSSIKKAGLSTHNFPKDKKLRQIWIDKIGREYLPASESSLVLCSEHFEPECFHPSSELKSTLLGMKKLTFLKSGAVPTIFNKAFSQSREDNSNRWEECGRKEMIRTLLNCPDYVAVSKLGANVSQNCRSTAVSNLPDFQDYNPNMCPAIENSQRINQEESLNRTNTLSKLIKTQISNVLVKIEPPDDLVKIEPSDEPVTVEPSDELVMFEQSGDIVNVKLSDDITRVESSNDVANVKPTDNNNIDNIQFEGKNSFSFGDFPSAKDYIYNIKMKIIEDSAKSKTCVSPTRSTVRNMSAMTECVNTGTSSFKINASNNNRQSLSRTSINVGDSRLQSDDSTRTSDMESANQQLNLSTILIPSLPSLKCNWSCMSSSVTSPPPTYVTFKPLIKLEQSEEKIHQESWIDKISAEEGLISTITIEKAFGVSE